jgi:ABC-type transport system involved in multi-copper enzyme maturation permease subunit
MFNTTLNLLAFAEKAVTTGKDSGSEWYTSIAVTVLFFLSLIVFCYTTRAGIIARATTKESIRQPIFILLLGIGTVLLVINTFVPFFTMGDDVKMLKECGLSTILISGLLLAVWTASTGIASEIEGKTTMTLLSKPINRRQFVVGKYIGIMNTVLALIIPMSIALCLLVFYKVGYDAKESAKDLPEYISRMASVYQMLPSLALIAMEIFVLTAISVAISTQVPMLVNIVTIFTIFVIAHLTPVVVQSGKLKMEFVSFMAQLIAALLPSLETYNMSTAVSTDATIPPEYLGLSAIYSLTYCIIAILFAFVLFEDRDLA